MVQIAGKYQHERSENIDEYFRTLGVPFLVRKMMSVSYPTLEISQDGDKFTLKTTTLIRTQVSEFTLGVEYEESMASGVTLKNTTTLEGDSLITISISDDGNKVTRRYDFTDDGVVLTMSHERSDQVAKRHFKRVQ
ncbi:fatty acid-binding protein, liver-like [Chelonus insularis]|uniref:fatty acid-binding protein, liver-like n=1 Tax=Chelonus insularis TaxID=460826 RepID=UPI00158F2111|nr:fatty acid-binding protein, liver-like [Chelonus insularis]XP_034951786.1 fatty acid-binding protein, liver-like [Chelonus insularis]